MAHIDVPITLTVDDRTRHWIYFQKERSKASRHKSNYGGSSVHVTQPIYDGRGKALSLDETSFELIDVPTALSTEDFYSLKDNPELEGKYFAEVEAVVKKKLGCDKIVFMHHQVRNASKMDMPGVAGYAGGGPHTDSSTLSGDELAMHMLKGDADTTRYKRYLYVNLWRNISEDPIENDHLAFMDERTAAKPDDYIPRDLFGPGYSIVQYGLNARHAKNHKWYYFPNMKKNEGVLFKQSDSDFTLPGRICFHMSVNDPTAPKDAKPRQSIELRMFCYWKEAAVDSMPTEENMYLHLKQDPEQLALEDGGSSHEGSFGQLCCRRRQQPTVQKPVQNGSTANGSTVYTGNPDDYVPRFKQAIQYYSSWPASGKQWAEGLIKQKGAEKGLAELTQTMVNDDGNYQGVKHFAVEQKQAIVEALLADATYMSEAKKQIVKSD